MKYFGSILDFTKGRNADLMRAYRIQLELAGFVIAPKLFRLVADSPAARFWVSEERAFIVISSMLSGNADWDAYKHKPGSRMSSIKKEMFEEILHRVKAMRQACPERSLRDIVAEVVLQPAPKFYLSPRTVGEYIYRIKNGWYDKQYDRYRKNTDGE